MGSDSIPDLIVARFRTLSLERVARIEGVWNALIQGIVDPSAIREMSRDLHTLKGDAKIIGFEEVSILAHKLEELGQLAAEVAYQISDDFELVVTMALQFLGMLLKKKSSSAMSGIDLAGFVRTVDEVLHESRAHPSPVRHDKDARAGKVGDTTTDRLSETTRARLAVAATTAFLEYLGARGVTSRNRLRGVWKTLREELARVHAIDVAPLFERHAIAARELATQLGKHVEVVIDSQDVRLDARAFEALDLGLLHLVRNSLDHGIAARGTLRIVARDHDGTAEIVVADDGRGIDLAAVRAKATERGLVTGDPAALSDGEVIDLLFHPGFSTRSEVTELSGRGVGLDAVKTAIVRLGGTVSVASKPGEGMTVTLTVPSPARMLGVYRFLAPGGSVALAVSARWVPTVETTATSALDPIGAMQLSGLSRQTSLGPLEEGTPELAIRFRWGFLDVLLRSATEPALVRAERICPTPDDHPVEVVLVGGQETLLLRPEHVAEMITRSTERQRG